MTCAMIGQDSNGMRWHAMRYHKYDYETEKPLLLREKGKKNTGRKKV